MAIVSHTTVFLICKVILILIRKCCRAYHSYDNHIWHVIFTMVFDRERCYAVRVVKQLSVTIDISVLNLQYLQVRIGLHLRWYALSFEHATFTSPNRNHLSCKNGFANAISRCNAIIFMQLTPGALYYKL